MDLNKIVELSLL